MMDWLPNSFPAPTDCEYRKMFWGLVFGPSSNGRTADFGFSRIHDNPAQVVTLQAHPSAHEGTPKGAKPARSGGWVPRIFPGGLLG